MDFIKDFTKSVGVIALTGMGYAIANPSETACADDDCDRDISFYNDILYPGLATAGVFLLIVSCAVNRQRICPDRSSDYQPLEERDGSSVEVPSYNRV
ncbi:MAG: hypothetical protein P1U74_09895 [Legionellaceae bacterium]|nr:hypothetical protein [Legionellaceae bacterium]